LIDPDPFRNLIGAQNALVSSSFIDILDMAEKGITGGESMALDLQEKARSLLEACKRNL